MYEIFEKLLQERGITPYRVSKATGIASSTLSDWKNGVSTPKADKLQKIADYFGVTLDYLTGREEFSDEQAMLDARISEDLDLKEAIRKYYTLSDEKRKHIIELINLL